MKKSGLWRVLCRGVFAAVGCAFKNAGLKPRVSDGPLLTDFGVHCVAYTFAYEYA